MNGIGNRERGQSLVRNLYVTIEAAEAITGAASAPPGIERRRERNAGMANLFFDATDYPWDFPAAGKLFEVLVELAKSDDAKWIRQTYPKCAKKPPGLSSPNTPEGTCREVLNNLTPRKGLEKLCNLVKLEFPQNDEILSAILAVESAVEIPGPTDKREDAQNMARLTRQAKWVALAAVVLVVALFVVVAVLGPRLTALGRTKGVTVKLRVDPSNRFGHHAVTVSKMKRVRIFLRVRIGQNELKPIDIPDVSGGRPAEVVVRNPRGKGGEELAILPDESFHVEAWENNGSEEYEVLTPPLHVDSLRPLIDADNVVRLNLGQ